MDEENMGKISKRIFESKLKDLINTAACSFVSICADALHEGAISAEEAMELFDDFFAKNPDIFLQSIAEETRAIIRDHPDEPPAGLEFPDDFPSGKDTKRWDDLSDLDGEG